MLVVSMRGAGRLRYLVFLPVNAMLSKSISQAVTTLAIQGDALCFANYWATTLTPDLTLV